MEHIIESIVGAFSGSLPKELIVFVISMVPILELRGSLLAAGFLNMEFFSTFIIAVIGNFLPIPFILLFIDKIFAWLKKTKLKNMVEKLENKALAKSYQIKKYGKIGLFLFVAIPVPGTGAWMGSLIAMALKLDRTKAFLAIGVGVIVAGLLVSCLFYLLPDVFHALFY